MASNKIIPATKAVKFPSFNATSSDGKCIKLPVTSEENVDGVKNMVMPAYLLCLSFRASSQVCRVWYLLFFVLHRLGI